MMEVIRQLVAEGWQVTAEDLAQLSPYLTSHILRFVGCVGAEPEDVGGQVGRELGQILSGHLHLSLIHI